MKMQIVDVRISKHSSYCLSNIIAFGDIGIDHVVTAIEAAQGQQADFQNLW